MPNDRRTSGSKKKGSNTRRPNGESRAGLPSLEVQVIWGDITLVKGDVYVSGHYENVLPQNAELALDRLVSGKGMFETVDETWVLRSLTRRGILRGALGDVALYPCPPDPEGQRRFVAIAGMGHPGKFGPPELRGLARNLTVTLTALPDVSTVCSVLIGGGAGNLPIAEAVSGLLMGMADALEPGGNPAQIQLLRLVEFELGKAREIHRHVRASASSLDMKDRLQISVPDIEEHAELGGKIGDSYCMALALAAAALAASGSGNDHQRALRTLLGTVDHPPGFVETALTALTKLTANDGKKAAATLSDLAAALTVDFSPPRRAGPPVPTRISFVRDGPTIRAAALTEMAVTPERAVGVDYPLLSELVDEMTDPAHNEVAALASNLNRLVVPRDFREPIAKARTLVFEVDRAMAKVHWEMLSDRADGNDDAKPLALKIEVARQLRTTYSPAPSSERIARWPLKALVIGDPGDPRRGENLQSAQDEALEVAEHLKKKGVEVTLMVGAPSAERVGPLHGHRAAERLHVLNALTGGGFDLLHFAGHAGFDAEHPDEAGWVFEGGLLTARLLELVDVAPSLVFANACLSAKTSDSLRSGKKTDTARTEADLLPGLADEFFRRGVRNYIGTAWKVDDEGAREFAKRFYDALIPSSASGTGEWKTLGQALREARMKMKEKEKRFRALWAAYQHYGDPQHYLVLPESQGNRR